MSNTLSDTGVVWLKRISANSKFKLKELEGGFVFGFAQVFRLAY